MTHTRQNILRVLWVGLLPSSVWIVVAIYWLKKAENNWGGYLGPIIGLIYSLIWIYALLSSSVLKKEMTGHWLFRLWFLPFALYVAGFVLILIWMGISIVAKL